MNKPQSTQREVEIVQFPVAEIDPNGHSGMHVFGKHRGSDTIPIMVFRHPTFVHATAKGDVFMNCSSCGENIFLLVEIDDDETLHVSSFDPCENPNGMTTTVRVQLPSGSVVVADALRRASDLTYLYKPEEDDFDYGTVLGRSTFIQRMAEMNVLYAPVGNTCPGLFRRPDGSMVIARLPYDEEIEEYILPEGWTKLAWIITDLWAVTIADLADYTARGGINPSSDHYLSPQVVELPAGTYEMVYHRDEAGFADIDEADGDVIIYADITRVAE